MMTWINLINIFSFIIRFMNETEIIVTPPPSAIILMTEIPASILILLLNITITAVIIMAMIEPITVVIKRIITNSISKK